LPSVSIHSHPGHLCLVTPTPKVAAWELAAAAASPGAPAFADAPHIRLLRLDASDAAPALRRLGARAVSAPLLLFLFEGRLVDAGDDVRGGDDVVSRARAALAAGRHGEGRPLDGDALAAGGRKCEGLWGEEGLWGHCGTQADAVA
jgi:hypothetical protein